MPRTFTFTDANADNSLSASKCICTKFIGLVYFKLKTNQNSPLVCLWHLLRARLSKLSQALTQFFQLCYTPCSLILAHHHASAELGKILWASVIYIS